MSRCHALAQYVIDVGDCPQESAVMDSRSDALDGESRTPGSSVLTPQPLDPVSANAIVSDRLLEITLIAIPPPARVHDPPGEAKPASR